MSQTPKSRNWCFTLNNYSEEDIARLASLDFQKDSGQTTGFTIKYMIFGEEVGESGTPHLQGYVCFKNQVRLGTLKSSISDRAHFEIAKGTVKHNYDYCSKDKEFKEFGVRPLFASEKGELGKRAYTEVIDLAKDGDFDSIQQEQPGMFLQHYSTLKRIRADTVAQRELKNLDPSVRMQWYYGPSGTGKSMKARGDHPQAYLKDCNKWWCGYLDQDTVIVEDVDVRSKDWMCRFLKIWADIYPFPAEMKGSKTVIRPKMIIVTSNYHPKEIWEEESDLGPILRRFQLTHFPKLGEMNVE